MRDKIGFDDDKQETVLWQSFYFKFITPVMDFLIFDIPPGPPLIPSCYIVNAFKGLTLPLGVILMIYYQNFSTRAVLITALHGSYGLLWCLKSLVAPDELWYRKATFLSAVGSATLLGLYWSPVRYNAFIQDTLSLQSISLPFDRAFRHVCVNARS